LGRPFTILTDHKSIRELMTQIIQTPEQHYYLSNLLGYDYSIQYKAGATNVVADALSRAPPPTAQLLILSVPQLDFLSDIRKSLESTPEFQQLKHSILSNPASYPGYTFCNNLILFKGRIWLHSNNPCIPSLLSEYHAMPLGGHLDIAKTTHHIQSNFFWANLKDDVRYFIKRCSVCQQNKISSKRPAGLLQPLPIPTGVWEDLSMDFITHLPSSNGFTVIFVVVDRYSKGVNLGALPTSFTAFKVANFFLNIVCKLHGFPRSIVSDRDPIFLSNFWRELFRLSGTQLRLSTAYHPQSDGQTEVMNRILEQYLRCFVHSQTAAWFHYLALAEWCYNTSLHSSTGLTPFEIIYGKPPSAIRDYLTTTTNNEVA